MEHLDARLAELHQEFNAGQARLRELEVESTKLRDRMLMLSGAIQAFQEISSTLQSESLAETGGNGPLTVRQ